MTSPRKQRPNEPSIVVDPTLAPPTWCSEETVVFSREMLEAMQRPQPPKKKPLPLLQLILACVSLILAAIALRYFLHR